MTGIGAVLFDLDDTLYGQEEWLAGAWSAVAAAAPPNVDRVHFHAALLRVAAEGSDRGRIINRALETVGAGGVPVAPLVAAFRRHAPDRLDPYPGTVDGLNRLRATVPIALVTDGDPTIQRAKLDALGLFPLFDAVVFSDELGRRRRKPHPAPFLAAADALGVHPSRCLFVGDRPDKDVAGARAAGLAGAVRVRTGEYAGVPSGPGCVLEVRSLVAAVAWMSDRLGVSSKPV